MQLIYRGQTYTYNPAQATAPRPFQPTRTPQPVRELIYRGCTYRVAPTPATKPALQPRQYELIYRGTIYQVNRNEQGEVTAINPSGNLAKHRPWSAHPAM